MSKKISNKLVYPAFILSIIALVLTLLQFVEVVK